MPCSARSGWLVGAVVVDQAAGGQVERIVVVVVVVVVLAAFILRQTNHDSTPPRLLLLALLGLEGERLRLTIQMAQMVQKAEQQPSQAQMQLEVILVAADLLRVVPQGLLKLCLAFSSLLIQARPVQLRGLREALAAHQGLLIVQACAQMAAAAAPE
jgi:hypothetical protein